MIAQAQAEATVIIQEARATALVQAARTEADALLQQNQVLSTLSPGVIPTTSPAKAIGVETPGFTSTIEPGEPAAAPGAQADVMLAVTIIARDGDVELIDVAYAADSGFIMVYFTAPQRLSSDLYQGRISVTDETTGEVYNEIAVMPVIGPLISRPVQDGQRCYAMLINRHPWLTPGAIVTVVIANSRFEHILVK